MWVVFAIIAAASMIAGNLLALLQANVKRLLAYSSIAHLGYILVAFLAVGRTAAVAVLFYLVAYFVTTLGAFGVVAELSGAEGRDADRIDDYRGLGARRPLLAATFAVSLFSLAGIPLTAGFLGKFYVVNAGAGSRLWWLLIVLVASSTIGLYYYTRIVVAMYVQQPADDLVGGRLAGLAHAGRQPCRRRRAGRRHGPRPVPGYLSVTTHQAARARRGRAAVTPVAARPTRSRPAR